MDDIVSLPVICSKAELAKLCAQVEKRFRVKVIRTRSRGNHAEVTLEGSLDTLRRVSEWLAAVNYR